MKTQRKKLNFNGQNLYIGIDVHKKSWSVTILSENLVLKKFSQPSNPDTLSDFLETNFPGAKYYSVYEAGFCGFWIHHRLTELGIHNIVVNPADVPTMGKEKVRKTDAVDCNKLARSLRSKELTAIHVPCNKSLYIRSLVRDRNTTVKEITRTKNRIKSFLNFYGIEMSDVFKHSNTHWSKKFINWLKEKVLSSNLALKMESVAFLWLGCKHNIQIGLPTLGSIILLIPTQQATWEYCVSFNGEVDNLAS